MDKDEKIKKLKKELKETKTELDSVYNDYEIFVHTKEEEINRLTDLLSDFKTDCLTVKKELENEQSKNKHLNDMVKRLSELYSEDVHKLIHLLK
jgi:sugar-specific transcriptional regulator TrmB